MKIMYLWPLFFLLLIPVIIIMYLLKQKAVEKPISSLFLWKEMYQNAEANTPWEKLKKNWLLILQILTLLILILALCSPYFLKGGMSAEHAVVVIDNSASMNTLYEDGRTRLEASIEEAVSYVRKLHPGTGISVITSADEATLLYSNGETKNQAIDKIRSIESTNVSGDAHAGLEMVRSMQTQWKNVETVCFTDTDVSMEELEGYIVDMYKATENYAVDYVSHGYNNGQLVVLAKIDNFTTQPRVLDANLYGDGTLLQIQSVEIPAKESANILFSDLGFEGNSVNVEISVQDALAADNIAYDILDTQHTTEVLLMTEANLYLEKAMGLIQGISITKSNDIASFDEFKKQKYDVYIFDGMIPETLPEEGHLFFLNVPSSELFAQSELLLGVKAKPCEHALTEYVENLEIGVSETYAYTVPEWAESFLVSGNDCVAFSGEYGGRNVCVMGFDLHNSDMPLKTEFPVLIYNIMSASSAQNLVSRVLYHPEETVQIYGKLNEELPKVILPAGEVQQLQDYHWNYADTKEIGVYQVVQKTTKGELQSVFAVNFPTDESFVELTPSDMAEGDDASVKTSVGGVLNLRNIIILLSLLFLGIEWIAYLRK